jgi:hypothetical protein
MEQRHMNAPSIVKLAGKMTRAAEKGKGVRVESADLDLLGSLGLFDIINSAVAEYLKEQTQCRDALRRFTNEGNTGLDSTSSQTGASGVPISTSGGTTQARDVNAARQRVQ